MDVVARLKIKKLQSEKMNGINNNHFFADNTARDTYFTANPSECVTGLLISVGGSYQEYNGSVWVVKTGVVKGDKGDTGAQGPQGIPGTGGEPSAVYVVELNRWDIQNDGTQPVNTTAGINNAMTWASQNGYTGMVLPKGTYLIDKDSQVEPPSYFTLDLNGSTLKKETNGYQEYNIILFQRNQMFTRVTNGKIVGDKDTHDYVTITGTHEHGNGISIGAKAFPVDGNNAKYIFLDRLDVYNCTGDAITLNSTFGQITPIPTTLASSWEQGTINATTGALEASVTKIRSTLQISMTQTEIVKYGYFGLYGNGFGALGSGIVTDYYDVFFYQTDNTFISVAPLNQFFDEVEVPANASYARIVLHQTTIPAPADCTINIRVATFPQFVYIEKCNLHHSRRQGISVCGAKNIYMVDNEIHHIKGIDPQSGIDVEDGYDLNQYIYIDKNNLHHNEKYNVVLVNGKHLNVTNNTLLPTNVQGYASLGVNGGCDKTVITGNVIKLSKVTLYGEVIFSNNYVFGTQITVAPVYSTRSIIVSDNTFHNCKYVFDSPYPHLVKTSNCQFINDSEKVNNMFVSWTIEFKNEPQTLVDCYFEGQDNLYLSYAPLATYKSGWLFKNCRFKNVKTPTLYSGIYVGCTFTDIASTVAIFQQTGGNDVLELRGCKFYSTDSNNTVFTFNSLKTLKIIDCHMEKTSGWLVNIGSITGEVILKGNTFKIANDALNRSIITLSSTFSGSLLMLENNQIVATNATRVGIENLTTNSATVIMRGNVLTKATITRNGKEIAQNNNIDGIMDPYNQGTSAPTSIPAFVGQEFIDTTNKKIYRAMGTTSTADWVILN